MWKTHKLPTFSVPIAKTLLKSTNNLFSYQVNNGNIKNQPIPMWPTIWIHSLFLMKMNSESRKTTTEVTVQPRAIKQSINKQTCHNEGRRHSHNSAICKYQVFA